ncbi:hypothetical protein HHI36_015017 [Cryptolaemus montrouzieri]|uniref:Uncharacterized protein n=1 Tax=Cryptolaemus montrouzieri TaxID=559131 RepID=A0ABD2N4D3_9CUCU
MRIDFSTEVVSDFPPEKPQLYIIENLSKEKENAFLKGLRNRNESFNARGKYLFIVEEFEEVFLRKIANHFLLNAVFINSNSMKIATYYPYKTGIINDNEVLFEEVGICENGNISLNINNSKGLFSYEIPWNWENSIIHVMYHYHDVYSMCDNCEEPGIEIELFDTLSKRRNVWRQFLKVVVINLCAFLEQARKPENKVKFNSFVIACIIFLAFFMNIFFKSKLTYLLNGLNYEDGIDALEDAIDDDMDLGIEEVYVIMFNDSQEMSEYLEEHLQICDYDSLKCANRCAFERDMIAMQSTTKIIHASDIYFNEDTGLWLINGLLPPVLFKPIVAAFPMGHPMFEFYNHYLYRAVETGMIEKILHKYYDDYFEITQPTLTATKRLNWEHMVAPLFVWTIGNLLSLIVFILERSGHLDKIYILLKQDS